MTQYNEQTDSHFSICPYCKHEHYVDCEDYVIDETIIETCEQCDRKFHLETTLSVNHSTEPDCELNDERHDFENVPGFSLRRCKVCRKHTNRVLKAL